MTTCDRCMLLPITSLLALGAMIVALGACSAFLVMLLCNHTKETIQRRLDADWNEMEEYDGHYADWLRQNAHLLDKDGRL